MSDYHLHTYDTQLLVPATGAERLGAAVSHASLILAMPFVLPLVVYFLFPLVQPPSAYVRHQAIQAMLFHLFITVVSAVIFAIASVLWWIILIGWPFALLLTIAGGVFAVWGIVIAFIATLKAFQGQPYRMPIVGNWSR